MEREPLYQRVERLLRSRRAYVLTSWILGSVLLVGLGAMAWEGVTTGLPGLTWVAALFAISFGVIFLKGAIQQRAGRAARKLTAVRLHGRIKWEALNQALDAYAVRTGAERPRTSYIPRARLGDQITGDRLDAELVFAAQPVPGSGTQSVRGPLDALPGDMPTIIFTEAMLDAFDAGELLAVIAHLMARAAIIGERATLFGNGAKEADSRALLLTHDHASLLRALESCTKSAQTRPPGMGVVLFSDADLQARVSGWATEDQPDWDWDWHDRIDELRAHLMAAGLDVPSQGNPFVPPAKPSWANPPKGSDSGS